MPNVDQDSWGPIGPIDHPIFAAQNFDPYPYVVDFQPDLKMFFHILGAFIVDFPIKNCDFPWLC